MKPDQGEIWTVDFSPVRGHEQGGLRPALVLSVDQFNHGGADLVLVVPFTSKSKVYALRVPVEPPEGGLNEKSHAMVEMLRSVSKDRLVSRLGSVDPGTLAKVQDRVRILLGL